MSWFSKLNKREKTLLILVGGVFFVLFNLFFFRFAFQNYKRLESALATRKSDWKVAQTLLAEKDLWAQRSKWLDEKQPKAPSESEAINQLNQQITTVAKENGVLIQQPQPVGYVDQPAYTSVAWDVSTESSWEALIRFLHALKKADTFTVIESVNLQTDPKDANQMRGRFKIAKWYAPRQ